MTNRQRIVCGILALAAWYPAGAAEDGIRAAQAGRTDSAAAPVSSRRRVSAVGVNFMNGSL